MQQAGGKDEALLSAAGERARELLPTAGQPQAFEGVIDCIALRQLVQPADEVEVLADREVVVEAELLRQVADLPADLHALGAEVETEVGACARIWCQQPAQHADGGGLVARIRPETAADAAGANLRRYNGPELILGASPVI